MIALVTDSTAGLTAEEARSLGVRIVPHTYFADGSRYLEGAAGSNGDYARLLSGAREVRTVQTGVTAYTSTFDELRRSGFEVLCIVLSSRLSGAYSSARRAAQLAGAAHIEVVDSLLTAGCLRYLLYRARALCEKGLTLAQAAAAVQDYRSRLGVVFSVNSMDALRRSGRIGILRQSVGTILNQRPLMKLEEGGIVGVGMARGKSEQAKKLAGYIPSNARKLTVQYFADKRDADVLWTLVKEKYSGKELLLREGGPVLGIHVGMGTVIAAWETE